MAKKLVELETHGEFRPQAQCIVILRRVNSMFVNSHTIHCDNHNSCKTLVRRAITIMNHQAVADVQDEQLTYQTNTQTHFIVPVRTMALTIDPGQS